MHFKPITSVLAIGLLVAACGQGSDKSTSDRSGSNDFKTAATPPIHGAIFTTLPDGSAVNHNIYTDKEDVYLNGGPKKDGAAGLPDGDYYYIVIDPGCKNELAGPTAPAPFNTSGKIITVEDGEFTELMQLAPFDDTSNPGGEYQVRVTPVENYDEEGGGCFGFLPQYSKMDNFKVRPKTPPGEPDTFCISGYKWYDVDFDGEVDSGEVPVGPVIGGDGGPVAGITITLTGEGLDETTTTSTTGQWSFCGLEPGDYVVGEIHPEGWVHTFPESGVHEVTIDDEDVTNLGFGNVCYIDDVLQAEPCEIPVEDVEIF